MVERRTMVNEASRWARFSTNASSRYALALATTALALLGRWLLDPYLPKYTPYILPYSAVAASAIYAGFVPSIRPACLGLVAAKHFLYSLLASSALLTIAPAV